MVCGLSRRDQRTPGRARGSRHGHISLCHEWPVRTAARAAVRGHPPTPTGCGRCVVGGPAVESKRDGLHRPYKRSLIRIRSTLFTQIDFWRILRTGNRVVEIGSLTGAYVLTKRVGYGGVAITAVESGLLSKIVFKISLAGRMPIRRDPDRAIVARLAMPCSERAVFAVVQRGARLGRQAKPALPGWDFRIWLTSTPAHQPCAYRYSHLVEMRGRAGVSRGRAPVVLPEVRAQAIVGWPVDGLELAATPVRW